MSKAAANLSHTVETHEASCERCGKPHGWTEGDCVVLCRETCLRAVIEAGLPEARPETKGAQGEPHEHRKVICGQCMRPVGAVQMRDKGPTPAVFHRGACWEAYVQAGVRDPRGARPGR